jgi:hypothetical protein
MSSVRKSCATVKNSS